jgi:hypothetical protein
MLQESFDTAGPNIIILSSDLVPWLAFAPTQILP